MPHYIVIQVDGREPAEDLATLRTKLHEVIQENCMRAGDIVLRNDRDYDSLGNSLYEDFAQVHRLYTRRAEMYRAKRAEKAAARERRQAEQAEALARREARTAALIADTVPEASPNPTRRTTPRLRDSRGRFATRQSSTTTSGQSSTPEPGSITFDVRTEIAASVGALEQQLDRISTMYRRVPGSVRSWQPREFETTEQMLDYITGETLAGPGQLTFDGEEIPAPEPLPLVFAGASGWAAYDGPRDGCTTHCGPDEGHCRYCHNA